MTESFLMKMGAIQETFGAQWLEGSASSPLHPVRTNFRTIMPLLDTLRMPHARLPHDLTGNKAFLFMDELGTTLSFTARLPGFRQYVLGRLLNASEYDGAYYEARVARRHRKAGQDVRFIGQARNGPSGPDLRIVKNGVILVIEAKYKDRFVQESMKPEINVLHRELNDRGAAECPRGLDVTALYIGTPDEKSLRRAFGKVMQLANEGTRGTIFVSDPGLWLNVTDRTPVVLPFTPENLGRSAGFRTASVKVGPNPDGTIGMTTGATFALHAASGVSINGMYKSVLRASGQIGAGRLGVVYIDIDPMGRAIYQMQHYLGLLGEAVSRRTWGANQNTRIRALVISCGPIPEILEEGGHRYVGNKHFYSTIYHPDIPRSLEDNDANELVDNIIAHRPSDTMA